ncbi:STAS-like domain-containing protein [Furfurilactobacillus entadae]|uniref:STAS-like domain-containing protein n=1 Tax=Furfurilactobacillus entadae TaxID=2922307 RepID=UPI0035EE75DC
MNTIIIKQEIGTSIAASAETAQDIFKELKNYYDRKESVVVDFSDLSTITTAFLNASIGDLYTLGTPEDLNKYIHISSKTLTPLQFKKVKLVMDNAKTKLSEQDFNEEN